MTAQRICITLLFMAGTSPVFAEIPARVANQADLISGSTAEAYQESRALNFPVERKHGLIKIKRRLRIFC